MSKSYTPEQVAEGLQALLTARGNAEEASRESGIPATTLRTWRTETYADQYRRLEQAFNDELIDETKSLARSNAKLASDLERQLLEKVEGSIARMDGKDAAIAAEKVASVKAKSIDKLIALTGLDPGGPKQPTTLDELLEGMERKGLIRIRGREPAEPAGEAES